MILLLFLKFLLAASFVQTLLIRRHEPEPRPQLSERQDAATQSPTGRLVFCHFMMGIVAGREGSVDYDADMRQAKELGIDAFALNIGTDEYTAKQLDYAYESAARHDMKLFISFDFHYFSPTDDAARVGQIIAAWANKPAQLKVDAPISPWFSTHYGAEVSYGKNFVFPSDLLWYERWNQVLQRSPPFVEIITWNDFGESHYIAPLSSQHEDDGASKWVNDMPHDGWRDMAQPYIAAYKAGSKSVNEYIKEDKIIYWYRPTPRTVNCDSTDNTMMPGNNDSGNYFNGKPNGWEDMQDSVFLVSLLKSAGSIEVTSGNNTQRFEAPAGASSFKLDMGVGQQKFSLTRNSQQVLSGISRRDITDTCPCGLYNFNAYVGTLPEGKSDPLDAAGLASFSVGLAVKTCSAAPSLGSGSPAPVSTPAGSPTGTSAITATTFQTTAASQGSPSGSHAQSPSGGPGGNPGGSPSVGPSGMPSGTPSRPPMVGSSSSPIPTPALPSLTGTAAAPTSTGEGQICNGGTNAPDKDPNIGGLCSFSCSRGYCPPDACVCTSMGTPEFAPDIFPPGCPLELGAESESYKGLCMFSCLRGYCPPGACTTQCG
ncbi:mutanase [Diaporthe helianthi]|uniref:Mutanase n=1 Tax=Diaporthe helianthi TaxID=158607 RepID=A0A2P5HY93_DIAHE|nr:mutanase [Diaporthe helianthi]